MPSLQHDIRSGAPLDLSGRMGSRAPSEASPQDERVLGERAAGERNQERTQPAARLFLIAAGGTGGHVLPALQVARELSRRGHSCLFVGTERGQEGRLVPEAGFALELLRSGALKGVSIGRRLRTLLEGPSSLFAADAILERHAPAAMMSLGGYAAGPLLVMAVLRNVPVLILEPNAMPGLAHRLAGPFASRAMVGFPPAVKYFHHERVEIGGIPIREEFFSVPPKRHEPPFTILITGGSQGARRLNQAAVESLPVWKERRMLARVRFVHQTGAAGYEEVRSAYEAQGVAAEVSPFITDMPGAFAQADLVVCRAGASALAELAAAGKASILVPYPFAADQHQLRNAQAMEATGAARVVADAEWNGPRLVQECERVLKSPSILATMEQAARGQARPGAARRAADLLEQLAARGAA